MTPFEDATYLVFVILGITAGTFLTRGSFFVLPAGFELPPLVERALRYAPACALTAIVAPSLLVNDGGHIDVGWENFRLIASIAAGLVFVRRRNMVVMMLVGMAVFTALRLTVG